VPQPTSPPPPRATLGDPCKTCGRPKIRWPDGTQRCIVDHRTAEEMLREAEQRAQQKEQE